jgi:putative PIN family toxin of toxin-antitoxin system
MKVVTDTNVAISGLLWGGPPNEILKMARSRSLSVLACDETVQELKRAITYKKFRRRLAELKMSGDDVYAYFVNLALFVPSPREGPKEILDDPFDNTFLALAIENRAHLIVSGDHHLLDLATYRNIQIVTPGEACDIMEALDGRNLP